MADGCYRILKFVMFFFNFLFSLGGGALLGVGTWIVVDGSSFQQILSVSNSAIFSGVWMLLFVGGLLFFVGVLGCCGALNDSKCLIMTFFFVVLGALAVEVTGGIMAFLYFPKVEKFMEESMVERYGNLNGNRLTTDNWDTLQSLWECCGINGPRDWRKTNWVNQHKLNTTEKGPFRTRNLSITYREIWNQSAGIAQPISRGQLAASDMWLAIADQQNIPTSCCKRKSIIDKTDNLLNATKCLTWNPNRPGTNLEFLHRKGCKDKASMYFWLLGSIMISVVVVEVVGLVLSCCLYRAVDKQE